MVRTSIVEKVFFRTITVATRLCEQIWVSYAVPQSSEKYI